MLPINYNSFIFQLQIQYTNNKQIKPVSEYCPNVLVILHTHKFDFKNVINVNDYKDETLNLQMLDIYRANGPHQASYNFGGEIRTHLYEANVVTG